ncbi:MAG: hypothetical protein WCC36_19010 [Gammaproteobacteria bacterium]
MGTVGGCRIPLCRPTLLVLLLGIGLSRVVAGSPPVAAPVARAAPANPACFSSPPSAWDAHEASGAEGSGEHSPDAGSVLVPLFHAWEGRWNGRMTEVRCLGTETAPRHETDRYTVDAEMRGQSQGLFEFDAELDGIDSRTRRRLWFWWLVKQDGLRFGNEKAFIPDAPGWDVGIIDLDNDGVTFRRWYRIRTRLGTSVAKLDVRSMHGDRRTLTIREAFYTQGILAGRRTWHLQRADR